MGLARGSMRGVWKSREGRRRKQGQLLLVVEALTSAYSTLTETRHLRTEELLWGRQRKRKMRSGEFLAHYFPSEKYT